jgi:hypothetical protein
MIYTRQTLREIYKKSPNHWHKTAAELAAKGYGWAVIANVCQGHISDEIAQRLVSEKTS